MSGCSAEMTPHFILNNGWNRKVLSTLNWTFHHKKSPKNKPLFSMVPACGERGGPGRWRWMSQCIDSNWRRNTAALLSSGALLSIRLYIRASSPSVPHALIRHADERESLPQILISLHRGALSPPSLSLSSSADRLWSSVVCVFLILRLCGQEGFLERCLDICDSSVCLVVAFVLNGAGGEGPVKRWWRTAVLWAFVPNPATNPSIPQSSPPPPKLHWTSAASWSPRMPHPPTRTNKQTLNTTYPLTKTLNGAE